MARPQVVDEGDAPSPPAKKLLITKCSIEPQTWRDILVQPEHQKMDIRFGMWNGISLYSTGSLKMVARE
jgi:hypothetical protein